MDDAIYLIDIAKHFSLLDDLAPVKVSFQENRIVAEAMNGVCNRQSLAAARLSGSCGDIATVMCYGEFQSKVPAVSSTVGIPDPLLLSNLSALHPGVVPKVTHVEGSDGARLQIEFCGLEGDTACAMLQSAAYADAVVQVPRPRLFVPDVSFSPSPSAIKLMKTLYNKAKKQGVNRFWAIMNTRGRLFFSFDFNPVCSEVAYFEVASGLPYCQLQSYSYDAASVLKVLALADPERPVAVTFLNGGGLILDVVSALGGHYRYLFFGHGELIPESQHTLDWTKQLARGYAEDACMYADWGPDL